MKNPTDTPHLKKVLLFAHVPPPHHGQSYMVQLLLQALGGDRRSGRGDRSAIGSGPAPALESPERNFACFHINCQVSDTIEDIGRVRWQKALTLMKYCLEAIWCRWRYGAVHFFYVPGPGLRSAVYRDWLVMLFCRPFFRHRIFHWHSAGLADWLAKKAFPWERWLTRTLLNRPDLSIVLGESCRGDAIAVNSRRIVVVPNGIPDPCPDCLQDLLPLREARAASRSRLVRNQRSDPSEGLPTGEIDCRIFRVLFLGLCCREKGLFDAVEATAILNQKLRARKSSLRVQLNVAGRFYIETERQEFERRIEQPELRIEWPDDSLLHRRDRDRAVRYHGFVSGDQKRGLFAACDCYCFPTYYSAESFPLVLLEAMAFGMDIITCRWRNIPELLPPDYAGIVEPRSPSQIANALELFVAGYHGEALRRRFESLYTEAKWTAQMQDALRCLP